MIICLLKTTVLSLKYLINLASVVSLGVWEICESCELLVAASCKSLQVVVSYCKLPFSNFHYYCFIVTC